MSCWFICKPIRTLTHEELLERNTRYDPLKVGGSLLLMSHRLKLGVSQRFSKAIVGAAGTMEGGRRSTDGALMGRLL